MRGINGFLRDPATYTDSHIDNVDNAQHIVHRVLIPDSTGWHPFQNICIHIFIPHYKDKLVL